MKDKRMRTLTQSKNSVHRRTPRMKHTWSLSADRGGGEGGAHIAFKYSSPWDGVSDDVESPQSLSNSRKGFGKKTNLGVYLIHSEFLPW